MVRIQTPRLSIRDPIPSDLEGWHRLKSDKQNMRFVAHIQTASFAESRSDLQRAIDAAGTVPRTKWFFTISEAQTDAFLGAIGFQTEPIAAGTLGGIGWFLLPEHQGKGYATEAFRALIPPMFLEWGITCIDASCYAANPASERVMLQGGMHLVKEYGDPRRLQYQLTKSEWEKSLQP